MAIDFRPDFITHLSDGVLLLDADRRIVAVNPAMETLVERPASELMGKNCVEVIPYPVLSPRIAPATYQAICPPPALTLPSNFAAEPLNFFTQKGTRREVLASFTSLTAATFMLTLQDVSLQKRQERLQAEFIATASHQLRTPLASIKTSIGLLLDATGGEFPPLLQRLLANIQVSSLRLERVVNDLIELTNLHSQRIQLQPRRLEVQQLVEQARQLSQDWLASRHQTLQLDLPTSPVYVEADNGRISQVLGHLLSNASKFSPPDSVIRLTVQLTQPETRPGSSVQQVIFNVIDPGIGIAAEEKDFIFEKFYQAQISENTAVLGSGLGLPLAKVLVELSGGQIWFQSALNSGSTFSFSLPAA